MVHWRKKYCFFFSKISFRIKNKSLIESSRRKIPEFLWLPGGGRSIQKTSAFSLCVSILVFRFVESSLRCLTRSPLKANAEVADSLEIYPLMMGLPALVLSRVKSFNVEARLECINEIKAETERRLSLSLKRILACLDGSGREYF